MKKNPNTPYLNLLLLSLFSILIRGYKFGSGNHKFQIPLILKSANQNLYPQDYFFSFNHGNSYYYNIMGFFTNLIGLETSLFLLYILATIIYVFAIYKLTTYIFNNKYVGYLAVLLLIIIKPTLGTDLTFRTTIYHITIAIPILLFSLYYFLRNNYIISFLLLGVAFNLHGLSALHLLALYAIYFLIRFKHVTKKTFFTGLFLFGLLVSPLILSSDTVSYSFFSAEESWVNIIQSVDYSHAFPFQWTVHHYIITLPLIILGVLSFLYLKKTDEFTLNKKIHTKLLYFSSGFIILAVLATIFTQLYPIEFFIVTQLFRSTLFLMTLIMIYASFMIFHLVKTKRFLSIALFSALFFYDYVALYLVLPFLLYHLFSEKIRYLKQFTIIGYALGAFFLFLKDPSLIMAVLKHLVVPTMVFLFLTVLMYLTKGYTRRQYTRRFVSLLLVLLLFLSATALVWDKESLRHHIDYPDNIPETAWMNTMLWVRDNTNEDTQFLIPPYHREFRAYAQRGIYVDTGAGPAYFSKDAAREWVVRLDRINLKPEDRTSNQVDVVYHLLQEQDIQALAQDYHLDYVIFSNVHELSFPVVYKNTEYSIYSI